MAQRVGKPTRIEISRHRDAMVFGPCVLADGVVVSAATPSLRPNANSGDAIIKFDRALAGRVWEVPTERWELESVVDDLVLRLGPKGASVIRGCDGSTAWQVDSVQAGVVPEGIAVAHTDGEVRFHDAGTGAVRRAVPAPWPGRSYLRVHTRGLLLFPWVEDTDRLAFMPYDEPRMGWEIPYLSGVSAIVRAANDVEIDRYVNLLRAPGWIVLRARRQGWPASVDTRTPDYLIRVDDRDGTLLWCSEAVSADCFALTVAGHRAYVQHEDGLVVLDLETGAVLRRTTPGTPRDVYRLGPGVVFRNRVAFPSESGHIVVYDTDGEFIHVVKAGLQLFRGIEADGRLILATGQGFMLVYDETIWGA